MTSLSLTLCSVPTHSNVEHCGIFPTNPILFQKNISVLSSGGWEEEFLL